MKTSLESLPKAPISKDFLTDPFAFLARARTEFGDAFAIAESRAIFSRSDTCCGVVAVFGAERQRQVLSDTDAFVMPRSAALKLSLPERLVNLNRGLHSMSGSEHAGHKRMVAGVLRSTISASQWANIAAVVSEYTQRWKPGTRVRTQHPLDLGHKAGIREEFLGAHVDGPLLSASGGHRKRWFRRHDLCWTLRADQRPALPTAFEPAVRKPPWRRSNCQPHHTRSSRSGGPNCSVPTTHSGLPQRHRSSARPGG